MLLTRSRKLNSGSQAEAFAAARGLAPIATHVICAGQIIRRLDSYRSRLQQVMGKDWEKTAADLPKKIENFARQARPDSEIAAWMQRAADILFLKDRVSVQKNEDSQQVINRGRAHSAVRKIQPVNGLCRWMDAALGPSD